MHLNPVIRSLNPELGHSSLTIRSLNPVIRHLSPVRRPLVPATWYLNPHNRASEYRKKAPESSKKVSESRNKAPGARNKASESRRKASIPPVRPLDPAIRHLNPMIKYSSVPIHPLAIYISSEPMMTVSHTREEKRTWLFFCFCRTFLARASLPTPRIPKHRKGLRRTGIYHTLGYCIPATTCISPKQSAFIVPGYARVHLLAKKTHEIFVLYCTDTAHPTKTIVITAVLVIPVASL